MDTSKKPTSRSPTAQSRTTRPPMESAASLRPSTNTEKVVGERRIEALRNLGARTAGGKSAEEACRLAALALEEHDKDIPFALIYLLDANGETARLAATSGFEDGEQPPSDIGTIIVAS